MKSSVLFIAFVLLMGCASEDVRLDPTHDSVTNVEIYNQNGDLVVRIARAALESINRERKTPTVGSVPKGKLTVIGDFEVQSKSHLIEVIGKEVTIDQKPVNVLPIIIDANDKVK